MNLTDCLYIISAIATTASAIATVIYARIARNTLREIKIQRETTYKPEIVMKGEYFYIYGTQSTNGIFPVEYSKTEMGDDYIAQEDKFSSCFLELYNIGLAAAKDIQIEFKLDLENAVNNINEMNKKVPIDKAINIKLSEGQLQFIPSANSPYSHSYHNLGFDRKKFDYILPANINPEPNRIYLPGYFLEMNAVRIYNFWLDQNWIKQPSEILPLYINLNYKDIGNTIHYKNLEVHIKYEGGSQIESRCYFEIKEV